MPSVRRKSAMRVRDGRVQRKNNWVADHRDHRSRAQAEIQIEREDPRPGCRHVVSIPQLRAFIELLPDWDELAVGLDAIVLAFGHPYGQIGYCSPGVVGIRAWHPRHLWWEYVEPAYLDGIGELWDRLNVETVPAEDGHVEVRWTEAQARAFMLLDVLVHELGHHHDRMTSRGNDATRGEPYAFAYARRVQGEIFDAYVRRFGI